MFLLKPRLGIIVVIECFNFFFISIFFLSLAERSNSAADRGTVDIVYRGEKEQWKCTLKKMDIHIE